MTDPRVYPEVRVFIQAIRAGKPLFKAAQEYCWASCTVPIRRADFEMTGGDPERCPPVLEECLAFAAAFDAFDEGASDIEIEAAFMKGLCEDIFKIWRPMTKAEEPTFSDLINAMSLEEKIMAAKFFGVKNVALAIAGRKIR